MTQRCPKWSKISGFECALDIGHEGKHMDAFGFEWEGPQQEHERLIREMAELVGADGYSNEAIHAALTKLDPEDPDDVLRIRAYELLNEWNTEACEKAERER